MSIRIASALLVLTFAAACASEPAAPPAETTESMPSGGAMTHDMPMGGPVTPPTTDAEMIASAQAAAPAAVSADATVLGFDEKMQPRVLKKGTNMWTCMPDMPTSPGADPMCLDQNGLAWAEAWMARKDPPAGKIGFGYMLMGGSDANNDDPFAEKPAEGREWIDTGPHVMIFNPGSQFDGYPTVSGDAKTPYVMWANTPYRHLMIPVE